jgi:carboxypeptidase C (cathepsin A)
MTAITPRKWIVFLSLALVSACVHTAQSVKPASAAPAAAAPAQAEVFPGEVPLTGLDLPYVTRHRGTFNGKPVAYTATVGVVDVADAEGNPGASIISIAYVADPEPGAPPRPVMFVFNGGPISPSVYLHMGAFGPKRVRFADDLSLDPKLAPLGDNPYSILDVADLVYFDPAGTGFSRAAPDKPLSDYFSVAADAQQTAAFITGWLAAHGRSDAPAWIFGESYGTNRAVETAGQLAQQEPPVLLAGVILFGQAVNIIEYAQRPDNIISYAVSLPTLAALGWYHGKAQTGGAGLEEFVRSAWDYARTDYLLALFQGNSLPAADLSRVADRLEAFTGLRSEVFVEQQLRVSKELYRVELLREEGLVIGRSDGRYVGPVQPEGAEEGSPPPDPAAALPEALAEVFATYLETDLGVPSAEQYVIASPVKGLDGWGWGGQTPFSRFDYGDALTVLLEKSPSTRVLVAAGYHDTMTTTGASQYLLDQERWPAGQVALAFYPGGHMAYSIEDSARAMAEDLRRMIAAFEATAGDG